MTHWFARVYTLVHWSTRVNKKSRIFLSPTQFNKEESSDLQHKRPFALKISFFGRKKCILTDPRNGGTNRVYPLRDVFLQEKISNFFKVQHSLTKRRALTSNTRDHSHSKSPFLEGKCAFWRTLEMGVPTGYTPWEMYFHKREWFMKKSTWSKVTMERYKEM